MKDHEIALLINDVRDIAIDFSHTQQLRERLAYALVPHLKEVGARNSPVKEVFVKWLVGRMTDAEYMEVMTRMLSVTVHDIQDATPAHQQSTVAIP